MIAACFVEEDVNSDAFVLEPEIAIARPRAACQHQARVFTNDSSDIRRRAGGGQDADVHIAVMGQGAAIPDEAEQRPGAEEGLHARRLQRGQNILQGGDGGLW